MIRDGRDDVLIVGAGIAGMASAVALARAGARVRVLETRRKLGGRATSFTDPRTGAELDNCQHVALGCCTHYQHLLAELDQPDALAWTSEQTWIEPGGRRSTIRPAPLPAPLHGGPSLLGASFLSASDKLAITRATAMLAVTPRASYRGKTFADFLADMDQPLSARRRFWDPIIVSACNLPPSRCAAGPALKVFQEGFLASASAGRIGVPRVALARLYDRFGPIVQSLGGAVELGASVSRIDERGVTLADGRTLRADRVICALPYERAIEAIAPEVLERDGRLAPLRAFAAEHSPILGVHLAFEQPVLDVPHAVLVSDADVPSSTQWLFAKPAAEGVPADQPGQVLHAVISAAAPWDGLDEGAVVQRVLADIHRHIPSSRGVPLLWGRMVREKRATFPCTPSFEDCRPGITSARSELILAGDYCDIGWPATMEGAARAGHEAAGAILARTVGPADASIGLLLRPAAAVW
jgi:zeta-carotene desaturase